MKIERRTATGGPQGFSEFVYDYASRRAISREWVYQNGAFVETEEKRRVFNGLDVVQERNAQNQVTAQLVRDGNISGILSRTTADGAAFYGYDGNGNVTLLTDASGADVAHYRYDAWGNTLEAVGPRAGENPYRFSTKEVHAASGLIDFGYRFYSPSMGRWINRDPLGEAGGVNLYAMVGNSPVNGVDEYGLIPNKALLPKKYQKYQGTNFSRKEMDILNRLHQKMEAGGAGVLVPYLKYGGKADLGRDEKGRKVLAYTRTGRFYMIGTITTLDNDFFTRKDTYFQSQLQILIHEALHAYVGVKATGGAPSNPPHARVYEWAQKIADNIEAGGTTKIPTNLDEVIRHEAIPQYKVGK